MFLDVVSDVPSPVPKTNGDKDEDSDEWEEVGKKNKTTVIITVRNSFIISAHSNCVFDEYIE